MLNTTYLFKPIFKLYTLSFVAFKLCSFWILGCLVEEYRLVQFLNLWEVRDMKTEFEEFFETLNICEIMMLRVTNIKMSEFGCRGIF